MGRAAHNFLEELEHIEKNWEKIVDGIDSGDDLDTINKNIRKNGQGARLAVARVLHNVKTRMPNNWYPGALDWVEEVLAEVDFPEKATKNKSERWIELPYEEAETVFKGLADTLEDAIKFQEVFGAIKKVRTKEVWEPDKGWFKTEIVAEAGRRDD